MVKVVERPVPKYHCDCKKCGAYLEYLKEDVSSKWEDSFTWQESIVCPNCGKKIIIYECFIR